MMRFENLKVIIMDKLEKGFPAHLHYHNFHHVLDVLNASIQIAEEENIDETNLELIKVAVLFHDAGFIIHAENHEKRGCEMAKEMLPGFNFTAGEIENICNIIMATKNPQTPHNINEQIICDADLDYLGRNDYDTISRKLFDELNENGNISELEWLEMQIKFLERHKYFTNTSIRKRKPAKELKLAELKDRIKSAK
ncbi:hypothetical protein BH09BAC5_BH09BAC5_23440 [soil metagenome]